MYLEVNSYIQPCLLCDWDFCEYFAGQVEASGLISASLVQVSDQPPSAAAPHHAHFKEAILTSSHCRLQNGCLDQ